MVGFDEMIQLKLMKVNAAKHKVTTVGDEKPIESEGFEEIIDFLNASYVKYALTVNPKVYTSCIEQFLATAKVKNVNGEAQIQALIDKKKVIITEASIRRDLRFEDKGGVNCLSNEVIFEQLTLMRRNKRQERKKRKETEVISPSSDIPNEEGVPTTSNDPLPSGEDRMQLNELMILCTNLQKQVIDLEEAKTAQAKEIASLKKRVKKLEQKRKSRTLGLKRLRKVGSSRRLESSTEITLVDETQGRMNEEDMFGVNDLDGNEVVVDVSASKNAKQSVNVVEKEVTTAGEVVTTAGVEVTTAATTLQISKDELTPAQTLIEIKAAKPKDITTDVITVTVAGTRPKEKGIVMQETSETPSSKPIISSQEPSQAKDKGKGKIIEEFVPMDTDLVKGSEKVVERNENAKEGSSKRAGIPDDDDVTIKATPLSSKSPTIVDYKIYKEGRKSYFKIIKADGNSQNYLTFRKMFKNFNREDLKVLWSIVKARFKKTKPVDDMDNLLFQTLKTMFEHQVEDNIWKY
uniref:Uncharacterized protein n=1 Tax=Tanacetum cinerariifolium TaxID=118510 RepID=A0A6L2M1A2_TANCI|nr:hypothetical protein [Tanacetum cinerariifolium]